MKRRQITTGYQHRTGVYYARTVLPGHQISTQWGATKAEAIHRLGAYMLALGYSYEAQIN